MHYAITHEVPVRKKHVKLLAPGVDLSQFPVSDGDNLDDLIDYAKNYRDHRTEQWASDMSQKTDFTPEDYDLFLQKIKGHDPSTGRINLNPNNRYRR